MNEHAQPNPRRMPLLRLLAAALAGGLGAFGVPAASHASTPTAAAPAPAIVAAPDPTKR
jgi:hypothetical protein